MKFKEFISSNDVNLIDFPKYNWEVLDSDKKIYSIGMGLFSDTVMCILHLNTNILSISRYNGNDYGISLKTVDIQDAEQIVDKIAEGEELEIPPLFLK